MQDALLRERTHSPAFVSDPVRIDEHAQDVLKRFLPLSSFKHSIVEIPRDDMDEEVINNMVKAIFECEESTEDDMQQHITALFNILGASDARGSLSTENFLCLAILKHSKNKEKVCEFIVSKYSANLFRAAGEEMSYMDDNGYSKTGDCKIAFALMDWILALSIETKIDFFGNTTIEDIEWLVELLMHEKLEPALCNLFKSNWKDKETEDFREFMAALVTEYVRLDYMRRDNQDRSMQFTLEKAGEVAKELAKTLCECYEVNENESEEEIQKFYTENFKLSVFSEDVVARNINMLESDFCNVQQVKSFLLCFYCMNENDKTSCITWLESNDRPVGTLINQYAGSNLIIRSLLQEIFARKTSYD